MIQARIRRVGFTFARANAPFPLPNHSRHAHHLTRLDSTRLGSHYTTTLYPHHPISKMQLGHSRRTLDVCLCAGSRGHGATSHDTTINDSKLAIFSKIR
ncbi:BQ5605_C031g10983 [Microbotryum silenes-dioicae]|uniref:BQ5605_C031g10983 protein n=1 Tax=Microbotryum silenes-dioicae TaxID=796604 RepID=A0A2X0MLG5_9BASI|nr:BQ5605_C031g10983 [Microbotryum silenes-dioicae]